MIDRFGLILDIFANRAKTKESKLQVTTPMPHLPFWQPFHLFHLYESAHILSSIQVELASLKYYKIQVLLSTSIFTYSLPYATNRSVKMFVGHKTQKLSRSCYISMTEYKP